MRTIIQIISLPFLLLSCTTDNKTEIENRAKKLADSLFKNQVRQQDSIKKQSESIDNISSKKTQVSPDTLKNASLTGESTIDNSSGFENINGTYKFYNRKIRDDAHPENNGDWTTATNISIELYEQTGGGYIVIEEAGNIVAELQAITFSCTITGSPSKKIDKANHIVRTTYMCDVLVYQYQRNADYGNDLVSKSNFKNWLIEISLNEATYDFRVSLRDTDYKQTFMYSHLKN